MAFKVIVSILLAISCSRVIGGQTTSTSAPSSTSTSTPPWINPALGGKFGNPGASTYLSNKTIDTFHAYAADAIARAIQTVSLGDLSLPVGPGVLTIKSPRIAEVKLANFEYDLIQPNRIHSHLFNGRLVADGVWQYHLSGSNQSISTGKYRATINDGQLETVSQLGRTMEATPVVQTIDCKANFSRYHVDIDGAANLTSLESCDDPICVKARTFYEDAICQILRKFVKDVVNARLATFPTRVNITEQLKLDYNLLNNEPIVTNYGIWTGLEGRLLWRGMGYVPFSPASLNLVDKKRALSFGMADYTFNTLFHQAHSQGFRFSAADLLSKSPSIQNQLTLNCSSLGAKPTKQCLGSFLDNFTSAYQFASNETGDLVYKTEQKAASIFILSDRTAYFDGGVGNLDIYGPVNGKDQQRQLLARTIVQLLRGEFTPKWNGVNITGTLKIVRLTLDKAVGQPASMTKDWLLEFAQFALPILTETFNIFLSKFAQFPIPLLDGFQCTTPDFIVSSRTMQVDCDIQSKL